MLSVFKKLKFIGLLFLFCFSSAQAANLLLPGNLIALNSTRGENLFYQSNHKINYLPLSIQFVTQQNLAYCAVASSVMVLNALGITAPVDPVYKTYAYFTQDNFFTPAVSRIITPDEVQHHGMTLDQLGQALATFSVHVKTIHADKTTLVQFRQSARQAIDSNDSFIIVNFFRPGLKEEGSGHMSPLAAYDALSDRFLLLDVARYKYPPVWVSTQDLWTAINTLDNDAHAYRGFLLVQKK